MPTINERKNTMQVQITPVPLEQFKPVDPVYTIKIGDTVLGKMNEKTDTQSYRWHTVLDSNFNINIYQGFGLTQDESLRDAINTNRSRRINELKELDELENIIWGDNETN
jgi:hypothetical protein